MAPRAASQNRLLLHFSADSLSTLTCSFSSPVSTTRFSPVGETAWRNYLACDVRERPEIRSVSNFNLASQFENEPVFF